MLFRFTGLRNLILFQARERELEWRHKRGSPGNSRATSPSVERRPFAGEETRWDAQRPQRDKPATGECYHSTATSAATSPSVERRPFPGDSSTVGFTASTKGRTGTSSLVLIQTTICCDGHSQER